PTRRRRRRERRSLHDDVPVRGRPVQRLRQHEGQGLPHAPVARPCPPPKKGPREWALLLFRRIEPIRRLGRIRATFDSGGRKEPAMPAITLNRKWPLFVLALAFGAAVLLLVLMRGAAPDTAKASSHAEAPLIRQDPRADNP